MTPDQIKAIRAALNMTQAEFAAAMGSSTQAVQKWEQGSREPRGAAVKLLEQLGERAAARASLRAPT